MNGNKENIIADFTQKQSTYFSKNYDESSSGNFIRQLRRKMILDAALPFSDKANVLDVGCGPEILYGDILKRCSTYVALDLTPDNLNQIKNKHNDERLSLVCSDIDSFEWNGKPFDIIICSGSLEYTDEPQKNLLKLLSWLSNEGVLVASFPNARSPFRTWNKYVYRSIKKISGRMKSEYHRLHFTVRGLTANINKDKYQVAVQYFGHKVLLQPFDMLFKRLDQKLTRFLTRTKPKMMRPFCVEFLLIITGK